MNLSGKKSSTVTPVKEPKSIRSKVSEMPKKSENSNPNLTTPVLKSTTPDSRSTISAKKKTDQKTQKSARKSPNLAVSARNKIRERKFVVAKKNRKREESNALTVPCKCQSGGKSGKCVCIAYQNLRASQEGFFRKLGNSGDDVEIGYREEEEVNAVSQNPNGSGENLGETVEKNEFDETEVSGETGSVSLKRSRDKLLEEARQSIPEPGSGRVKHLVEAFEKLLSIRKSNESDENELEDAKKGVKWSLPGLQLKDPEIQVSTSSFCPSDFLLTSESLGLDSRVCCSLNGSQGSFTVSSRTSGGGGGGSRRSRRNSVETSGRFGGRNWRRRQRKVTSQKPFNLRTEQRGRCKEEEFIKKVHEKMIEEEKQRIPIAQGLPYTTDEPERLVKPPVKESTKPVDVVLHSDVRAVDRAEFDHQVAEKWSLIEQYRMEMERQQKLEEEEEIRRLRKELVPRAQPMPYFDRPFIPRRSEKHPTIPKEPRFHIPQHKKIKSCMSWNDMYTYQV